MLRYTVEDIMREGPCSSYTRERVIALWGDAESLSPADIARLPIPIDDRLWALWRLLFRLSPPRAFRAVRLIAIDALDLWDPPDIMVWFLGTGDERAQASARAAMFVGTTDPAALAAEAATWIYDSGTRTPAEVASWAYVSAARAAGGGWVSDEVAAKQRYLSWVVKAFNPFTPVGGLL